MPIEIKQYTPEGQAPELTDEEIEKLLFKEDDSSTLQGEVIGTFLLDVVDWNDVFDMFEQDEELKAQELVQSEDAYLRPARGDTFVHCEADHEDAIPWPTESIDGGILAQVVDFDDLTECFKYWVDHLPENNLAEKATKRIAQELCYNSDEEMDEDEDGVSEKRGVFRKMHKAGGAAQVNRMLGAMLKKGVITRAKKGAGKGYKKGDYDKNPAGYSTGTAKGVKAWKVYKKGKGKAKIKAAAKKARSAIRKAGKVVSKGGKKKIKADVNAQGANLQEQESAVHQGAHLAGRMLGVGKPGGMRTITEDRANLAPKKKKDEDGE